MKKVGKKTYFFIKKQILYVNPQRPIGVTFKQIKAYYREIRG